MNSHFTVLAFSAFAVILQSDGKPTDILQIIQHNLKSDHHRAWENQRWNATVKGTLGMTLLSQYKIPYNVNIHSKGRLYQIYSDCAELKKKYVGLSSGVYTIRPQKKEYRVYCDMKTNGGGWTVIQRRFDGSVDFYRTWNDYKNGFGKPGGEYWLGNDALHELTRRGGYRLRVELTTYENVNIYAEYKTFAVGSESSGYTLSVSGYSGNAGDSMTYSNGCRFSTKDRDLDTYKPKNCAQLRNGAWWYKSCTHANLNALYSNNGKSKGHTEIYWYHYKNNVNIPWKKTTMMIKKA